MNFLCGRSRSLLGHGDHIEFADHPGTMDVTSRSFFREQEVDIRDRHAAFGNHGDFWRERTIFKFSGCHHPPLVQTDRLLGTLILEFSIPKLLLGVIFKLNGPF